MQELTYMKQNMTCQNNLLLQVCPVLPSKICHLDILLLLFPDSDYNTAMIYYTAPQIHSIALLILFSMLFLYKARGVWKRFQNKSILRRNRTLKKLKRLPWDDFELLTMELFSKMGWEVLGNEKKGADGGVDIWMKKSSFTKKNISAIVQCKRYDDALVTIKVIREMYGLMHEYDADEVYIVTTSRFTKECYPFTEEKKITLIDGESLVKLIQKYG